MMFVVLNRHEPQLLLTTLKLFVSITGVNADRVDLIDEDYSPSGKQTFIMWMCSKNNTSELTESENLALFLATRGLSSIFFTKVRCGSIFACHSPRILIMVAD